MKKIASLTIVLLSTSLYCFSRFQMPQWRQYFNNKNIKSAIDYTKSHPYFSTTIVGASVLSALLSHKYNIPKNYYIPAIALSNAALLYGKSYFDSKQKNKALSIEDFTLINEPLSEEQTAEKQEITDIINSLKESAIKKIELLNALKGKHEQTAQGTGSSGITQNDRDFSTAMVQFIENEIMKLNQSASNCPTDGEK